MGAIEPKALGQVSSRGMRPLLAGNKGFLLSRITAPGFFLYQCCSKSALKVRFQAPPWSSSQGRSNLTNADQLLTSPGTHPRPGPPFVPSKAKLKGTVPALTEPASASLPQDWSTPLSPDWHSASSRLSVTLSSFQRGRGWLGRIHAFGRN